MSKARLSVGTNTPTGEPADGPAGPYVTDKHDDEVAAVKQRPDPSPAKPRHNLRAQPSRATHQGANERTSHTPEHARRRKGPDSKREM